MDEVAIIFSAITAWETTSCKKKPSNVGFPQTLYGNWPHEEAHLLNRQRTDASSLFQKKDR